MFRTFLGAVIFSLSVLVSATGAANAGMPVPTAALLADRDEATPVTFWAQPYPYRYVPRRGCPLVRVETPYGWYMDRVCFAPGPVLRRAY